MDQSSGRSNIPVETLVKAYRLMLTSRVIEEKMIQRARSHSHFRWYPGIGHEGIAAAFSLAVDPRDIISPTYRLRIIPPLARNVSLSAIIASSLGKQVEYGKHRLEKYNLFSNFHFSGALASTFMHSVGLSLSFKQKGSSQIVLYSLGDGTTTLGDIHEGLNFAALNKLPLAVLIVTNRVFFHTGLEKFHALDDLSHLADAYDIPGTTVNGNDFVATFKAVRNAVTRARKGAGPSIVNAECYRWTDHNTSWKGTYPYQEKVKQWKKNANGPLQNLKDHLTENNLRTPAELNELDRTIKEKIEQAIEKAKQYPEADSKEAAENLLRKWCES